MSFEKQAREIKVKAEVMGSTVYVTNINAFIGVGANAWPRLSLTVYPPVSDKKAVKPTQSEIISKMAQWQKKMFSERGGTEVSVNITVKNDDKAGTFKFKGLITGPTYDISSNGAAMTIECVPEYAQVDALSYSIYSPPIDSLPLQSLCNLTDAGTICNFIKMKQEELRTEFSPDSLTEAEDKAYRLSQHNINEKVAKYFEELLKTSDSEAKFGWTEILDNLKLDDTNLSSTISQLLMQSAGPFCGVIDKMAEVFGCMYVPTWEKIGYFMNTYNLLKQPQTLEIETVGMSISAVSGFGMLPPGFVSVVSPYGTHEMLPLGETNSFVVYPKENAEKGIGVMYQTQGPCWINDIVVDQEAADAVLSRTKSTSVNESKKTAEQDKKKKKKKKKDNLQILERWGKAKYINIALASSTVDIVTPLTFKPEVGKYYIVKDKGGPVLFKGLLAGISHSISTARGGAAAHTNLQFSHVQLSGFELPHAN